MRYDRVKRDLRRAYDAKASARDTMADQPWKQPERERVRDLLRAAGVIRLLEIGAGHGVSGRYFADEGFEVVCTDLSPALIDRCRAKGLDAYVMDFAALALPSATFDAVFGMNCLLHVPRADLDGVLREVCRVLAPAGLFYWGQYGGHDAEGRLAGDDYRPQRFFSRMTDAQVQQAASRVFDVVDFRSIPLGDHGLRYQSLLLRRQE